MPKVSRRVNGKLLTAEERSRPDHGADGLAMVLRSSRVVETKDAGIMQRQMDRAEVYPLDRYDQYALLTERQLHAGRRLALYYAKGFGFPKLVADLTGAGATMSEERAASQTQARKSYTEAMECVPHSGRQTVVEVVRGEWPRRAHALLYLREAFDAVANHWGLPRVVSQCADN